MNQLLKEFRTDLQYAFRQFRRSPGFTATALITLALGIGVHTAAFTLMYGILLRPLPVPHPEQLYSVGDSAEDCCENGELLDETGNFNMFSFDLYSHLAKSAPEFEHLAATSAGYFRVSLRGKDTAGKTLPAQYVTGNFFATMGIEPFMGRLLTDSDDSNVASPVVVISYNAWKREFRGDKSIVGSQIFVHTRPMTIVGIAPRRFYGDRIVEDAPALWIPISYFDRKDHHALYTIGRIRPGTPTAPLQGKLSNALREWLASRPEYANEKDRALLPNQHVVLVSAARGMRFTAEQYDPRLKVLMLLASIVLLIACSNIANLLLVRSISRRAILSVGIALGASRFRVVRLIFTETLLLGVIGGTLGIGLAFIASRLILAVTFSTSIDLPIQALPSPAVLFFALLTSIGAALLFGMAPARLSLRIQPIDALRGFHHSTPNSSTVFQRTLLVLQATLSLVLLVGAFLTVRSLYKLV
jgi:predicted permease